MTHQPFVSGITPVTANIEPSLWFAFAENQLLCREQSSQVIPQMIDFLELGLPVVRQHYLGALNGNLCYAVELEPQSVPPSGMVFKGLREAYAQLGEELFDIAGRASQIIDWDRNHQFCGRCGAKTILLEMERGKQCPQCKLINYPRLSPAIIVRVTRGQEILLARAPHWSPGRYSILAGFVEPGESMEQAVQREVFEEVGIQIKNITYFGSQPWPFPNSLMIGFTAEYAAGQLTPDRAEIEDAGWYTRDNLPQIPPKMSISRRLIDDFIETNRLI